VPAEDIRVRSEGPPRADEALPAPAPKLPSTATVAKGRDGGEQPFEAVRNQRPSNAAIAYSITSLAVPRSDGATVMLSARAVFRLTTSSNLSGFWTGKSPGLPPFRIRST
jgi:hypothetical protein